MEQLIFLVLIAIGSLVSNIIQEKKKRKAQAERKAARRPEIESPHPEETPQRWPQTPGDWQETLRRMLEPEEPRPIIPPPLPSPQITPPPITRTVTTAPAAATPAVVEVRQIPRSARAYAWAVGKQPKTSAVGLARKWVRDPQKLREAVAASIILGPPKALDDGRLRSW